MDSQEIERYVAERFPAAARRLERGFNGWADGEDAVQEALIRAWLCSERGQQVQSLPGWVTTVATNVARAQLRGRQAEERALRRLGPPAETEEWPERLAWLGPVADAVVELPRRQAQILVLHYYGDLSVAEVAAFLRISPGTVKSALHRARATLAGALRPARQTERTRMRGWDMTGSHGHQYDFERVAGTYEGRPVVKLWCTVREPAGFGAMVQRFRADRFRGERVRLSGALRGTGVDGWLGLWFRVDDDRGTVVSFDNMEDRAVRGTTGWQPAALVLDVPDEAATIHLGMLLAGGGEGYVSGLRLETVPADVPATGRRQEAILDHPVNLDFTDDEEEPARG